MIGENGTKIPSKNVWNEKDGIGHLDVENPDPGGRPGQIHYQEGASAKKMYDFNTRKSDKMTNKLKKLLKDHNS